MPNAANDAPRRPWRRCGSCGGVCHWHEDAWVCDEPAGCGDEWYADHDPKYAAPGSTPIEAEEIRRCDGCGDEYNAFEESHVGHVIPPESERRPS